MLCFEEFEGKKEGLATQKGLFSANTKLTRVFRGPFSTDSTTV